MRKFLTLMLCVLMALSMCAVASAEEKVAFEMWITADTVPTDEEKVTESWYYAIEQAFEAAYPQYDLQYVGIGANSDDYNAKWQMAAAADNLPDIVYGSFGYIDDWSNVGLLLNLQEVMPEEFWGCFAPGAVESVNAYNQQDGIYGLPVRAEVQGWYYNEELFEQCGLEIPTTWTEFMNCVETFVANGITPIAHGATDIWSIWGYHAWFVQYGLTAEMAAQLQNREIMFADNDAFRKTFERIAELAAAGAYDADVATTSDAVAAARFYAGEAAMKCYYDTASYAWNDMLATGESDIASKAIWSFGPQFEDAVNPKAGLRSYGWTFMPNAKVAGTAKEEALKAFFTFFYSEEGSNIVRQSMPTATNYEVAISDDMTKVQVSLNEAYTADINPCPDNNQAWFDQSIKVTYRNAVTGLICGTLTVDDALLMMQDWADTM